MFGYFICIGAVVVFVLLVKQTITKDEAGVWGAISMSALMIMVLRSELEKNIIMKKIFMEFYFRHKSTFNILCNNGICMYKLCRI